MSLDGRAALNEHLCPMRRHKRLKYMQAVRSSSQSGSNMRAYTHAYTGLIFWVCMTFRNPPGWHL